MFEEVLYDDKDASSGNTLFDVAIIGGGINGTGIARDAAGRGLKVFLCDKGDLGGATSSASTKLIHGGLRYLEHYEFRLVREALKEREVLLESAPHVIWPMQFILPHNKGLRPYWLVRAGLFIYDYLGGKSKLPPSSGIKLENHIAGKKLKKELNKAFVYSDCWVQDSRLVILNAMDAKNSGAVIVPRTKCISAKTERESWKLSLEDGTIITSRILVNATGPWGEQIFEDCIKDIEKPSLRLVQGSHIVVKKLFDHEYGYIFQNDDKRIIFAIPYEENFTLIGTTDVDFKGNLEKVAISNEEISYLCKAVNKYFKSQISKKDIVWSYSGIRPLVDDAADDAQKVTRDYHLELVTENYTPLLNVFGGKITTYRKLAENAVEMIMEKLEAHNKPAWTATKPLPGGDFKEFKYCLKSFEKKYDWMPKTLIHRYIRNYGTLTEKIIGNAKKIQDLGKNFGGELYEAEIRYLIENEWAKTAEDILWRRSKLGLHVTKNTVDKLTSWLQKL